jgi:hypothetical protein
VTVGVDPAIITNFSARLDDCRRMDVACHCRTL